MPRQEKLKAEVQNMRHVSSTHPSRYVNTKEEKADSLFDQRFCYHVQWRYQVQLTHITSKPHSHPFDRSFF